VSRRHVLSGLLEILLQAKREFIVPAKAASREMREGEQAQDGFPLKAHGYDGLEKEVGLHTASLEIVG
jgi:hypothetical protein